MAIKKVIIKDFKCYEGQFCIEFNNQMNILVGDNEAGKSTILEAINLAFSGLYDGKYIKNELNQYLFNNSVVNNYISKINSGEHCELPSILIEVYLDRDDVPMYLGNGNSEKSDECGFKCEISFNEKYKDEYEIFLEDHEAHSLPIEYYEINWQSFARDNITPSRIPVNTSLIDSSSTKFRNGSDIYISRIIKTGLEAKEVIDISQAHRRLRDGFRQDEAIKVINKKIDETTTITDKKVELSVELLSKNAWETSLTTYLDEVPFRHIGKGEQCLVKTELAMKNSKSKKANIILIEEPENHLSHSKLNSLLRKINESNKDKQLIISTHNSFVANKLGISNIQILNNKKLLKLNDLTPDTRTFFEKIAGYDTLRLILCKKAILVEGDSDELVVQKAYMNKSGGRLPIEDEIDVISVGTSFLRFLEIAKLIEKPVNVVTDNDGNVEALEKKYENYLKENKIDHITICFDNTIDEGELKISGKPFNYNTLEPKILKVNNLSRMNKVLGTEFEEIDDLLIYMKKNKTECALKVFQNADEDFVFPDYILEGIE